MIRESIDLAAHRKNAGLSQAQLAEQVGVSQATISRLEQGESEPSLQLLVKVARALSLDIKDIADEEALGYIVGHQTQDKFYAFCPNPLCPLNELSRKDGQDYIHWRSGDFYPTERYQEVNFCTRCGTDLAKECPDCGRRLESKGSRFCISCGTAITERPTEDDWRAIAEYLDAREVDDEDIPF